MTFSTHRARSITAAVRTVLLGIALGFALVLGAFRSAHAHTIGLSTGEYTPRGASLVVKLAFARAELATLAPALDANRDGHVTPAEVEAARPLLQTSVLGKIAVASKGAPCAPVLTDAGLMDQDGLLITGRFDCATLGAPFDVDLSILDALPSGHRHIARTIVGSAVHDEVLERTHRTLTIAPEPASDAPRTQTSEPSANPTGALSFFRLGLGHILTGYDHLLFLLALVLVPARLRSLLATVTAFTVAHSITLALAALNVVVLPSRVVEPAIALSIVYVALENLFVRNGDKRWRITLPFGLVHGFGFAGALQELALPRSELPGVLALFNVGVEVGQLAVLAIVLPLVVRLRRAPWFEQWGGRATTLAIALVGAIWFVARVVSG